MSSSTPTGEFPAVSAPAVVAGGSEGAGAELRTRAGADDPRTTVPDGRAPRQYRVGPIIAVLVISAFVMILNETLLSVALPTLMEDLEVAATTAQWLSTGFMLTMAVVIPTTGFLMRRLSVRTLFTVAMVLFLAGTVLAAASPTFGVLLTARVIQAAGTAMVLPLLTTTTLALVPVQHRGTVMGLSAVVISAAPALGPTVSGLILQNWTWHHLFLMMLPIIMAALIVGLIFMRNYTTPQRVGLDVLSVILSALGFGGIVYALSSISAVVSGDNRLAPVIGGAVGLVALALFLVRQLRRMRAAREPLLDLRPLGVRTFTVSLAIVLVAQASMLGTVALLPLYMTGSLGIGALQVGLTLLPAAVVSGVLGPVVGRLYDRLGPRPLVIPGISLMAAVMWLQVILFGAETSQALIIALNVPFGVGMGMVMTPLMTLSLGSLPRDLYGHGSAILNTVQQLAGALGTAVFIAMLTIGTGLGLEAGTTEAAAQADGTRLAFAFGGVWALLGVGLSFTLRRLPPEPAAGDAANPVSEDAAVTVNAR